MNPIPLFLVVVGITGLATVKIQPDTNPYLFYGSAFVAALCISLFVWFFLTSPPKRRMQIVYFSGWVIAISMLAFAITILVNLEPYVPPTQ